MTMTEALAETKNRIAQATYTANYTDAMIVQALNRAHRKLITQIRGRVPARYTKAGTALDIVANTDTVDLPADCVSLRRLDYKYSDVWYPMDEKTSDEIPLYKSSVMFNFYSYVAPYVYTVRWRDDVTGDTARQYIELSPVPTAAGTGVLRPWYHYVMDDLTLDGVDTTYFQLPDVNWEHLCIMEALNILYTRDVSVYQNYNFQQELMNLRQECFSSLVRESSKPRRIRKVC